MPESQLGSKQPKTTPLIHPPWLTKPYIWALASGIAIIGAIALYSLQREFQTTLKFWSARVAGVAVSRTWILGVSLQESHDDSQVLADFASRRESSLLEHRASGDPVSRGAESKQVAEMFEEYKRVYEYAAVALLDSRGEVVVESADLPNWAGVIREPKFKAFVRLVMSRRQYVVDMLQT